MTSLRDGGWKHLKRQFGWSTQSTVTWLMWLLSKLKEWNQLLRFQQTILLLSLSKSHSRLVWMLLFLCIHED